MKLENIPKGKQKQFAVEVTVSSPLWTCLFLFSISAAVRASLTNAQPMNDELKKIRLERLELRRKNKSITANNHGYNRRNTGTHAKDD